MTRRPGKHAERPPNGRRCHVLRAGIFATFVAPCDATPHLPNQEITVTNPDCYCDPTTHLDAVALVKAKNLHDGRSVQRVLDTADLPGLVMVLGQMVQTAVATRMTLDQFLAMLVDKAVSKASQ